MAEIKFHVEGIVCTGCAMDMENILLAMDGVKEAAVDFNKGVFSIEYDPGGVDVENIIIKVKKLGFKTKIIAR